MPYALVIKSTGEPFRLADSSVFALGGIHHGAHVPIIPTLVFRGRKGKREYGPPMMVVWDSNKHRLEQLFESQLEPHETRRAKELLCWKYHPEKCKKHLFELAVSVEPKSIVGDRRWLRDETIRVLQNCRNYFIEPKKYGSSAVPVLCFDLKNLIDLLKKEGDNEGKAAAPPSQETAAIH